MKKFENYMLASDIDSTFIWHNGYTAPRNLEAVRYFNENGGRFSFASGRNHLDYRVVIPGDPAEFATMPYVLCNGSFLFDAKEGKILNPHYVDESAARSIYFDVLDRFPMVGIRGSFEAGFLVLEEDLYVQEQVASFHGEHLLHLVSREDLHPDRLFKIVVTFKEPAILDEVGAYLRVAYADFITVTRSNPHILEVQPKGISKAYQLRYLREEYRKINPDIRLWCVGDYDNDLEMLEAADVACCPENATDKVKSICDHIVCHCKDGAIADIVELMEKEQS